MSSCPPPLLSLPLSLPPSFTKEVGDQYKQKGEILLIVLLSEYQSFVSIRLLTVKM